MLEGLTDQSPTIFWTYEYIHHPLKTGLVFLKIVFGGCYRHGHTPKKAHTTLRNNYFPARIGLNEVHSSLSSDFDIACQQDRGGQKLQQLEGGARPEGS